MIYPAILVATIMSAQGPLLEELKEFPDWQSCVQAEQTVHKDARKSRVAYRNPYGKTYYVSRVQAYCRAK